MTRLLLVYMVRSSITWSLLRETSNTQSPTAIPMKTARSALPPGRHKKKPAALLDHHTTLVPDHIKNCHIEHAIAFYRTPGNFFTPTPVPLTSSDASQAAHRREHRSPAFLPSVSEALLFFLQCFWNLKSFHRQERVSTVASLCPLLLLDDFDGRNDHDRLLKAFEGNFDLLIEVL